jgi:hypothetical protein
MNIWHDNTNGYETALAVQNLNVLLIKIYIWKGYIVDQRQIQTRIWSNQTRKPDGSRPFAMTEITR